MRITRWKVEANIHSGKCGEEGCSIKLFEIDLVLDLPITIKREELCFHVTLEMILTKIPELMHNINAQEGCFSENGKKPHEIWWSLK
jgi:hypothetical protein